MKVLWVVVLGAVGFAAPALAYINGGGASQAASRNLCGELSRYIGMQSNGVQLTSISSCSIKGNRFTVSGTLN